MKNDKPKKPHREETEVILLEDLVPRKDVKAGSGKILFGERLDLVADEPQGAESKRVTRKR